MKDFTVLMTSCSPRKNEIINCLYDNADNANVSIYATNCDATELPSRSSVKDAFVVPRNDASNYIDTLLALCEQLSVDILIPRLSSELEVLAHNVNSFEKIGVQVNVSNLESLKISNDKEALYNRYHDIMPFQLKATGSDDIGFMSRCCSRFCCKLPHSSGAMGFAIVDDELCNDVTKFHAYGQKHYISTDQLRRIVDTQNLDYILQEFVPGLDYTVSLLANCGQVTHICGYVGYEMDYSCIMYGEIKAHKEAFEISRQIVKDLNLDGNVGIDFILKPDGHVVLLEVNPRLNATLPFVAKAGCNMPYLRCKQLLGYDITDEGQNIVEGLKMRKHYVAEYFV